MESNTQETQEAIKDQTHLAALLARVVPAAAAGRDRILVLNLVKDLQVIYLDGTMHKANVNQSSKSLTGVLMVRPVQSNSASSM